MDGKVADSAVLYDRKNNCLINKDLFALAGLVSIAPPEKMPRLASAQKRPDFMSKPETAHGERQWYVMRDLKRANAKRPAYLQLQDEGFEVFTPMKWRLSVSGGRNVRQEVPFIPDLLFVHASREMLDPAVERTSTLQYRFVRGGYCEPMVVEHGEMERFIRAVRSTESPRFYLPEEITPSMLGRRVRIVGGPLNDYEGRLVAVKGTRARHLLVELPSLLAVSVRVDGEFIEFIP